MLSIIPMSDIAKPAQKKDDKPLQYVVFFNYLMVFHIRFKISLVSLSKFFITTSLLIVSVVGYCANNCRRVCSSGTFKI